MTGRFRRLAEADRPTVTIIVDGSEICALEGDTLLTALLTNVRSVRESEFGDGRRAGFCLMAACQDCWVWTQDGARLRACSTLAEAGLEISTQQPGTTWTTRA